MHERKVATFKEGAPRIMRKNKDQIKWTSAYPTVSGWYWVRNGNYKNDPPFILQIVTLEVLNEGNHKLDPSWTLFVYDTDGEFKELKDTHWNRFSNRPITEPPRDSLTVTFLQKLMRDYVRRKKG